MDLGCGTGILSMFAVKAGAAKVIAVESATIYKQTEKIFQLNKMTDKITLVKGKIEEVELPVSQVDIILCDWMGFCLFQDSMVDAVILARDKYLAPGGLIFPDRADLFLTAIEDGDYSEKRSEFWEDVYGFDMTCVQTLSLMEPLIDSCNPRQVVCESTQILSLDLRTATKDALLDSHCKFSLRPSRQDGVHAFVAYFVVHFPEQTKLSISTAPTAKYTHWRQTVFCLREALLVKPGDEIQGELLIRRNPHKSRDMEIKLSAAVDNYVGEQRVQHTYRMQ